MRTPVGRSLDCTIRSCADAEGAGCGGAEDEGSGALTLNVAATEPAGPDTVTVYVPPAVYLGMCQSTPCAVVVPVVVIVKGPVMVVVAIVEGASPATKKLSRLS